MKIIDMEKLMPRTVISRPITRERFFLYYYYSNSPFKYMDQEKRRQMIKESLLQTFNMGLSITFLFPGPFIRIIVLESKDIFPEIFPLKSEEEIRFVWKKIIPSTKLLFDFLENDN